ncbi:unnamed protein product, partial [marine sediment metagenome]
MNKMENKLTEIQEDWYQKLINDLRLLNFEGIVRTKHAIGKRILKDELKFERAEYGKKTIKNLADDLDVSKTDLYWCIQFVKKYPEISNALENRSWRYITQNLLPEHKEKPETPPMLSGTYRIIYADPPWQYRDQLIEGYGAAEHHYQTMSIQELCDMDFPKTTKNAVLFLWVTAPLLEECFEVIHAWGFEYKTNIVWYKKKHNFGHYTSVRHEHLLLCTKRICLPDIDEKPKSLMTIERTTRHSEKPE